MAYDKVRRCLYVVLVETAICHPQLESHYDGVAALVELRIESIRRSHPVEQAIAGHRAVSQLLFIEQEGYSIARCCNVAVKQEASPCFIEIAREDFTIRAEIEIVGVSCRDSLSPWRGQARHYCAREGLIFGRLHYIRAQVVFGYKLAPLITRHTLEIGWWGFQSTIVSIPP